MKFGWRRTTFKATGTAIVCLTVLISACSSSGPEESSGTPGTVAVSGDFLRSEDAFVDVQLLRGIPVDEFMDTMGMFSAALLFDCTDCHGPQAVANPEGFTINTPMIQTSRRMIAMVNAINNNYFNGEARVSCFTCHHGDYSPEVVPDLALQYGPPEEKPNSMNIFPDPQASADPYFENYIQALGGAERLAGLNSYVATGTYAGYETGLEEVPLTIYAQAPDKFSAVIEMLSGDSVRVYDGTNGWISGPERPVPLMTLTGGNLFGARMDALTAFPAGIKDDFSEWQVGITVIDDRVIPVVQGSKAEERHPVNLYFNESTGLLERLVRWSHTAVGPIPIMYEYSDYRQVAGVQIPFHTVITWTNGRSTLQFSEVQANVAIDESRFTQPPPVQRRAD